MDKKEKNVDNMSCPNCDTKVKESDMFASFNYVTLIACPFCKDKTKPNNKAYISDIPFI